MQKVTTLVVNQIRQFSTATYRWSVEKETHHKLPKASDIIKEDEIHRVIERTKESAKDIGKVREILRIALDNALLKGVRKEDIQSEYVQGLSLEQTATLLNVDVNNREIMGEMFATALAIKKKIYGNRIVLFSPLYTSNHCIGSCLYCGYRGCNHEMKRVALSNDELVMEVKALEDAGHKRIMMLCGESPKYSLDKFIEQVKLAASTQSGKHGEIRRINVEIPQLTISDMRRLKETGAVGTYVNFQESYHRGTFERMHPPTGGLLKTGERFGSAMKNDYDDRLLTMDRAMIAGIDDVGIGALYGLYDYKFEVLSLLQHAQHLDKTYGAGPHTISVPRINPASGSDTSKNPPYIVDDENFKKIVAVIRMMVPYTGMILTTRETKEMRDFLLSVGISQMSAGSKTDVGSYSKKDEEKKEDMGQFALGDHRPTNEVIKDLIQSGYIPSWCTACYRTGRTGPVFMSIAKKGEIHNMCHPNALLTLQEYLMDYADEETKKSGYELIEKEILNVKEPRRTALKASLEAQKKGKRDLYF